MKLLLKFNILLIAVFGLGMLLISSAAKGFLERQARSQVLREASLISTSATAVRSYTEQEVSPLLVKTAEYTEDFMPQTIPFYAATKTFDEVRKAYPDYTYKEAALNPTNLRDRATDWESDIIHHFRDFPQEKELVRERETATGPVLALTHPIRVEQGCLQCHSHPTRAPASMVAHYGGQNGFFWNAGEIEGAQIISVPLTLPQQMAARGLRELLIDLTGIFLLAVLLIDTGLYFIVIRPLKTISASADRISTGEMDLAQLQVKGNDEVAQVTRSFNRMHVSLKKAMDLLNE